ncbi:hypothetical protein C474_16854 [Halogeometricum pallidum JCM 14848]|uniref:GIY-YIG domain-containing protein n=1 Tax=Halogeometricum pallidum JCM 14848 TaxID=1227487 RepID=M0CYU3_HALPD|nr:hypothetical protein [Halogeometricum pallidum]ELZ27039.1 hypothetical protein C474_16854 [Halogeometricum pallidum JCM 14848]
MSRTKETLWERWVTRTVLEDITAAETPDPVEIVDDSGAELTRTDAYDDYRLGRGAGDYLYLLYLLDEPVETATDIIPVYVGETGNIANRLLEHFRRLRDSLPTTEWADDGSWGSYSKYDHIATVYERATSPLYVWGCDIDEREQGPYGFPTYRHELEAKIVGLAHSHPRFTRALANRDFVPNRVPQEMAKVGPEWVGLEAETPNEEARMIRETPTVNVTGETKGALWLEWVDQTIRREIHDPEMVDPIPLFETDEDLTVALTERGQLKRSAAIETRIRAEGKQCVNADGVKEGQSGLLYVLYQLESTTPSPEEIVPRYIGKAEAYGKKNTLSANFEEIAKDRAGTQKFARWGDGNAYHVGELTNTVFGDDSKKRSWASELFEQGTHRLKAQTYLWVRAWDNQQYPSPYGYPAYLAEAEPLLIGLAYAASPETLLNHNEVPADAPANTRAFEFQPVPREEPVGK